MVEKNAIEMENTASNPLIFNHLNWNHQKYFKNAFKFVQKQNLLNFPDFQNDLISTKPFSATARNSRLQQSPLIELGITLPCKVEDFSVVEMQNDFGFATQQVTKENFHKNDPFLESSLKIKTLKWNFDKQSNENRHLLTLKRSAPIYNAFMVSDFVETEPIFETNENEIESITAIKFEIEYGQENNCFFDSTQESFQS